MKAAWLLVPAVLLAACTTGDLDHRWTKPAVAMQQLTLDDVDCARRAYDTPPLPDTVVGGLADVARVTIESSRRERTYARCMSSRGYTRAQ
jgi:hypothetical protein